MLDDIEPILGKAFLDCGAHTVSTGVWSELPIDSYIEFVNKHHNSFSLIAAPDVIGNTQKTLENFQYFIKRVEFDKSKIISVYHLQARELSRFDEVIEYSQEAGLNWIAIGGALGVGFTDLQKMLSLEAIYKKLKGAGNKFNVHLFGIQDPQTIKLFRPNSVDSATFIQKAKSFGYHQYELAEWKFLRDNKNRKLWSREQLTAEATTKILRHEKELTQLHKLAGDYDYVYKQLERVPDSVRFLLNNILSVVEFEKYATKELGYAFKHYITCSSSYVTGYEGLVHEIFKYGWAGRSLVAYPQFHEKNTARLEKELRLFGGIK